MTTMLSVVETYRCDSDSELKDFVEAEKNKAFESGYTLKGYSSVYKEKKLRGEVIDSAYVLKLTKEYNKIWEC